MYTQIKDAIGALLAARKVRTSGCVFKLLTNFTVMLLLFFTTLITLRNIFGDPIVCQIGVPDNALKSLIETKCWIEGVYVDETLINGTIGKDITRYGVGSTKRYNNKNFINQKYYQWIVPVLAIQALILSIPRIIWHSFDNGLISQIVTGADDIIITENWKTKKLSIVRFLKETPGKTLKLIAFQYWFCEIAALIALIFNMNMMNWVFNNFWVEYYPAITSIFGKDSEQFSRYAARLFPTQAKCFYIDFGPGGSTQERDALCFLPQNTINEKIFVFLYFWFIIILIIGAFRLIFSTALLCCGSVRKFWIRSRLVDQSNKQRDRLVKGYSDNGSFFLLTRLNMNLNSILFHDFVEELTSNKKAAQIERDTP